jgi:hypothetical protein
MKKCSYYPSEKELIESGPFCYGGSEIGEDPCTKEMELLCEHAKDRNKLLVIRRNRMKKIIKFPKGRIDSITFLPGEKKFITLRYHDVPVLSSNDIPCYGVKAMSKRWDSCPICQFLNEDTIREYGVTTA